MKECDKQKCHVSIKLLIIYISPNNVKTPCYKDFTTLHPTTRTLHFTTLVDTSPPLI